MRYRPLRAPVDRSCGTLTNPMEKSAVAYLSPDRAGLVQERSSRLPPSFFSRAFRSWDARNEFHTRKIFLVDERANGILGTHLTFFARPPSKKFHCALCASAIRLPDLACYDIPHGG